MTENHNPSRERPEGPPSTRRIVAAVVVVAVLYFFAGKLGILTAIPPGIATAIWPPSGIALAALLIWGARVWPGILLGSCMVNLGTLLGSGHSILVSLGVAIGIGIGSSVQALIGANLIQRWTHGRYPFERSQDVFCFAGAEAVSCVLAASFGTASLVLGKLLAPEAVLLTWATWWVGDFVGITVVAPTLLILRRRRLTDWKGERAPEALLLFVLLALLTIFLLREVLVLGQPGARPYMLFPLLFWATVRFGQSGAVISSFLVTVVMIWGTVNGVGPFVVGPLDISLVSVQIFIGVMSVLVLAISALFLERARAAELLRASDERLQLALGAAEIGIWDRDLINDSLVWSRSMLDIFEVPPDARPRTLSDLLSRIYEEDREKVDRAIADAIKQHGTYDVVYRVRRSNGDFRWVLARGRAFFDEEGKPTRVAGTALDITGQKRASEALAELAKLIDLTSDAIVVRDADDRIVTWNLGAEALYGWTKAEALGRTPEDLLKVDFRQQPRAQVMEAFERDGRWRGELVHTRKDGTTVTVASRWTAERLTAGKRLSRILEINTDITERKRAEEALQRTAEELSRSNHDLENFASIASHDLQEPLRMISFFLTLLSRKYAGQLGDGAEEYIHYAVDGANRMKGLIDSLLAYSRVGAEPQTSCYVDCEDVLDAVLSNLKVAIEESGVTIVRGPLPGVTGDPVQLMQLFQNLLGNAVKFRSAAAPSITIACDERDHELRFSFRDNGVGFDMKHRDEIFDIFRRLATKDKRSGVGIGLAVCRRIVENHGGKIWAESVPGEGSTFWFTLSRRAVTAAVLARSAQE